MCSPKCSTQSLPQQSSYSFPGLKQIRAAYLHIQMCFPPLFSPGPFERETLFLRLSYHLKQLHLLNLMCIILLHNYTVLFFVSVIDLAPGCIFIISVSYYYISNAYSHA